MSPERIKELSALAHEKNKEKKEQLNQAYKASEEKKKKELQDKIDRFAIPLFKAIEEGSKQGSLL